MPTIRERVESNIVIWTLGALLAGFLAGIATYEGALKMMRLEVISKSTISELESKVSNGGSNTKVPTELPEHINKSDIELLFRKVKDTYNSKNNSALYEIMGPIGRSQITKKKAEEQLQFLHTTLGTIKDGFFVQHQFLGGNGLYRSYSLNYSVEYSRAPKGLVTISIIDDGEEFQVNGMFFNRL